MGGNYRGDHGGCGCAHLFFALATGVFTAIGSVAMAEPGQSAGRIFSGQVVGADIIVHFDRTSAVVGETFPIVISLEAQPQLGSSGIGGIIFEFVAAPSLDLVKFEWLGELGDKNGRYDIHTVELPDPGTVFSGSAGTGVPLPEGVRVPIAVLTVAALQPALAALLETNILVADDIMFNEPVVGGGVTTLKIGCPAAASSGNDCNGNGVPDSCDLAGGSGDCNNNGIPDECDIADGTSEDVEPQGAPDGIPDECVAWTGMGEGDTWSNGENWQGESPPKNGGGEQFSVVLEGKQTNVNLDVDVRIDSLQLLSGAVLRLADGDLTIESPAGVLNNGGLVIEDGRSFLAGAPFNITGSGETRLVGPTSTLSSLQPNDTITNASTITGRGTLDAAFTNLGLLVASVKGGTLAIEGGFAKTNNGVMMARNGGTLSISAPVVGGNGAYRADGGIITVAGSTSGTQTTATDFVTGTELEIVNGAEFLVNARVAIFISGVVTIGGGGTYRADPLRTDDTTASLTAESVVITSDVANGHGSMILEDAMGLTSGDLTLRAAADCSSQFRGGCTPPRLKMIDFAGVAIGGNLSIETSAEIAIGDSESNTSVSFILSGDFVNRSTDPTIFNWDHGPLTLIGAGQTFEVAGEDRGPTLAGFDTNFTMDTITVNAGAEVTFRDTFGNHGQEPSQCNEALYVRRLILDAASTVTLDNCRVYYLHATGDVESATVLGCGALLQIPTGDFDGNGVVDLSDYGAFETCVEDSEPNALAPGCGAFDLHEDETLDVADFGEFQLVFGATP